MKKFKIGVLAALTLSLGITCNSLVFASRESFEMPDFNENPVVTGFMENEAKSENDINWNEEMFLSQNGEVLNFLLNDLKNYIWLASRNSWRIYFFNFWWVFRTVFRVFRFKGYKIFGRRKMGWSKSYVSNLWDGRKCYSYNKILIL